MLTSFWPIVLTAYMAMVVARFLVVVGVWATLYPTKLRFPFSWSLVMGWGGLRGALSMVLALSLPDSLIYKDVVVTMVFGVVLLSIFIQGLTIAPLAKWLGILGKKVQLKEYELLRTQAMLAQTALDEIEDLQRHHIASKKTLEKIAKEYQELKDQLEQNLQQKAPQGDLLRTEEELRVKRHILNVQKARLLEAYHKGTISKDIYERLSAELDAKLLQIDNEN